MTSEEQAATNDAFEHAWRYFQLHAGQRMSMFNYFVVAFGVTSAGLAGCLRADGALQLVGAALGLALALVSFVFWKMDQRTSFLIKRAEAALAECETLLACRTALFREEPQDTASTKRLVRLWTYGQSFRTIFCLAGGVGLAGALLSAVLFLASR